MGTHSKSSSSSDEGTPSESSVDSRGPRVPKPDPNSLNQSDSDGSVGPPKPGSPESSEPEGSPRLPSTKPNTKRPVKTKPRPKTSDKESDSNSGHSSDHGNSKRIHRKKNKTRTSASSSPSSSSSDSRLPPPKNKTRSTASSSSDSDLPPPDNPAYLTQQNNYQPPQNNFFREYPTFTRQLKNITSGNWGIYHQAIPGTYQNEILWTDGNAGHCFAEAPTIQAYQVVRRDNTGAVTASGLASASPYYFQLLN